MDARFIVTLFLVLCGTKTSSGDTTTPDQLATTFETPDPATIALTDETPDPTSAEATTFDLATTETTTFDPATDTAATTTDLTTTTELPTSTTTEEPTTTTAEATTTTTAAATTITAAATTAAITTTAAVTVPQTVRVVVFRSITANFTTDLLDSSSAAFKARASLIESQLGPIFARNFLESFISLIVVSFSNGSVINTLDAAFKTATAPNATEITTVLLSAASNVTGFDIEESSVTVDGTISGGVSHKFSLLTAFFLVLSSWLLSSQH